MNENLYIMHKKLPHKTLRVHSTRYTPCIHVSSCKLKLPKVTHNKKYKQQLPTHPFPKVELYIAVKCKNKYSVTNNDNRKKNHTHTHHETMLNKTTLPFSTTLCPHSTHRNVLRVVGLHSIQEEELDLLVLRAVFKREPLVPC